KGTAKCTATNGEYFGTLGNPDATTAGEAKNCWCHADSIDRTSVSSSWVFDDYFSTADGCAEYCAYGCASGVYLISGFRGALFGEGPAKSECVANEINVNWYNGETLYETNQCTYDGAITLPDAPEKTGYTFKGWKLVTGSSN
ncbi:MAG: InlB B-repeat-containing protein, partial [Alphaproteobacteria bacterium]